MRISRIIVVCLLLPVCTAFTFAAKEFHTLSGTLDAEAIAQNGNINTRVVTLRGEMSRVDSLIELSLQAEYSYGEADKVKNQNNALGVLNVDLHPLDVFSPFLLGSAEYNFQRGIDSRWQAGAGLKWAVWKDSLNDASLSGAVLFESTVYAPNTNQENVKTGRFSLRLKGHNDLFGKRLTFTHLSFLLPSLSSIKDYRWSTLLTLDVPLSEIIALRTSFSNTFENIVAEGRKKNDSQLLFGLKVTLK